MKRDKLLIGFLFFLMALGLVQAHNDYVLEHGGRYYPIVEPICYLLIFSLSISFVVFATRYIRHKRVFNAAKKHSFIFTSEFGTIVWVHKLPSDPDEHFILTFPLDHRQQIEGQIITVLRASPRADLSHYESLLNIRIIRFDKAVAASSPPPGAILGHGHIVLGDND
jgi:hypothetical protein